MRLSHVACLPFCTPYGGGGGAVLDNFGQPAEQKCIQGGGFINLGSEIEWIRFWLCNLVHACTAYVV